MAAQRSEGAKSFWGQKILKPDQVRYGKIFCSVHTITKAKQSGDRAVDLPARSFDPVHPGVAPPLFRGYVRAANAIFGRIGRIGSEEVIIQLIKSKCISVLVYGLEVCPLTKSDLKSLDFPVNRFFMKLFKSLRLAVFRCLMTVKYILVLTCQASLLSDSLRSFCP